MLIPNEYTGCEEYRGYAIVIRGDIYRALKDGRVVANVGGPTRADVRRQLDGLEEA